MENKVISSLRDHCTYNSDAQKKANYFSKILSILTELRSIAQEGVTRVVKLNDVVPMPRELTNVLASCLASTSCPMEQV